MDLDRTWESLVRPGNATDHFDLQTPPQFEAETAEYSPANAWWLSELCRLSYRGDRSGVKREEILARVGLEERQRVTQSKIHCYLAAPRRTGAEHFSVLVFRGTRGVRNWFTNVRAIPRAWSRGGRVHAGFQAGLRAVWGEIEPHLAATDAPLFYAGHSLGAALATLAASLRPPRALYTFGSPRVGDAAFARTLGGFPVHRLVHHADIVPTVPPSFGPLRFCHAGALHYIAHDGRMYREPSDDQVAADRRSPRGGGEESEVRSSSCPPDPLSDHAPVNYTARLERLLPE